MKCYFLPLLTIALAGLAFNAEAIFTKAYQAIPSMRWNQRPSFSNSINNIREKYALPSRSNNYSDLISHQNLCNSLALAKESKNNAKTTLIKSRLFCLPMSIVFMGNIVTWPLAFSGFSAHEMAVKDFKQSNQEFNKAEQALHNFISEKRKEARLFDDMQ